MRSARAEGRPSASAKVVASGACSCSERSAIAPNFGATSAVNRCAPPYTVCTGFRACESAENGAVAIRGLGVTSVEDPQPVTAHTVFPIASISKTFAATAMMRLVEQGKVDLRAPVRRYLPEFRVQDETVSREVTIWNLLTHSSGWEGQVSGPDRGEETLKHFVSTI